MAGRITPEMDWSKLDGMCMFDASARVCAKELGISSDTLERRIRAKYDLTFKEYKLRQLEKTQLQLKQKMINLALSGNVTCLIFSLKNLSKWSDSPASFHDETEDAYPSVA